MNLSPRGEAAGASRTVESPHSQALRGLLNPSHLEQRLSSDKAGRGTHSASGTQIPNPAYNLRLQIPQFREGENDKYEEMLRERPPSRQRNLPMHLNSDITLEKPTRARRPSQLAEQAA